MKKTNKILLTTLFLAFTNTLFAQEKSNNIDFSIGTTTNYIWRDAVTNYSAIQPSVTYTFKNADLYLNIWNSFGARSNTNDLETSVTLGGSIFNNENIELSTAFIFYASPFPNFGEFMTSIAFPIKNSKPILNMFFTDKRAIYTSFGILEHEIFHIKNSIVLLDTSFSYRFNDIEINNGFRDFNIGISTPVDFKHFTASIYTRLTRIIDLKSNHMQFGVNFNFK